MLEVGHCASHHKIPGPLAHTMIDIARKSLELWRRDERAAMRFATMVSKKSAKWSELTVPDCIGSSSPYGRYDISSEADNFPHLLYLMGLPEELYLNRRGWCTYALGY